jgi:hypothetical protein
MILFIAMVFAIAIGGAVTNYPSGAQAQKLGPKFETYRRAIKDAHQVDTVNFKEKIKGVFAAGKAITDYDLAQLIEGHQVGKGTHER